MIITTSPSFYLFNASGEAAELIASVFSPSVMADIETVIVLSKDFNNDIEPIQEIGEALEMIKDGLGTTLSLEESYNPLYVPSLIEEIDDVLDVDQKTDLVKFSALEGNPFTIKIVDLVNDEDEKIASAEISYKPFELPAYETIVQTHQNLRLN